MNANRIVITQGEFAVSDQSDALIVTLLGSCVAVCIWDPLAEVGGMNHMLLANGTGKEARDNVLGVHAMECLINGVLKKGGQRKRLRAKAFGGARMVRGLSDIGASNSEFALSYLHSEGIPLVTQSLGGTEARQLVFQPATGQVRQKLVQDRTLAERDLQENPALPDNQPILF